MCFIINTVNDINENVKALIVTSSLWMFVSWGISREG